MEYENSHHGSPRGNAMLSLRKFKQTQIKEMFLCRVERRKDSFLLSVSGEIRGWNSYQSISCFSPTLNVWDSPGDSEDSA
jgi:hypothetical protein